MIVINAPGFRIPSLIILSGILHLPNSLEQVGDQCWFGASINGWMTGYLFLAWAVQFVHWLSWYRQTLRVAIKNRPAILMMDGHASRINPAVIDYLRRNNVAVIIFLLT